MTAKPSDHALGQYASSTKNLDARVALHSYGINPQSWFSWLRQRLPLAGDVLEVGAGTGALWEGVDRSGGTLIVTDFAPAMCQRLGALPTAAVVRCDAAALPFADSSFDSVIANHMLYHLDDPDSALREFDRVLRHGGVVAVAVNGVAHLAELAAIGRRIGRSDLTLIAGQNGVTAEVLPARMARHFADVVVDTYPDELAVPSADPVLDYLESMTQHPLTTAQRSAARAIVEREIGVTGRYRIGKHTVLCTARHAPLTGFGPSRH